MYGILKAVQSFFDAIKGIFSYAETAKNKQCETDVVKNKKKLSKKEEKQEDLILDMASILNKYVNTFSKADKLRTRMYLKRIKKVN